jgi:integrase
MLTDQLSDLCTNELSDLLHTHYPASFSSNPLYEKLALKYKKKVVVNKKLQNLEAILQKISESNIIGKEEFSEYIRYKYRRNCKPGTIRSSFTVITSFLSFYKGKDISGITRQDIEAFVEHEQDRSLKPATVRTATCILYAFIKYLVENNIVSHELMQRKVNIKLPQLLPRAIDPDDINQLLSVIDNVRDRAMILLLLRTGMRIGELLNTRVNDIDLENSRVIIYEAEKTGVGRVVYFSDDAKKALMAWFDKRLPDKNFLFY